MRLAGAGCLRGREAEDTWPVVDVYGVGGEWGLPRCTRRRETNGRWSSAHPYSDITEVAGIGR